MIYSINPKKRHVSIYMPTYFQALYSVPLVHFFILVLIPYHLIIMGCMSLYLKGQICLPGSSLKLSELFLAYKYSPQTFSI